jgi:hypothetical protein
MDLGGTEDTRLVGVLVEGVSFSPQPSHSRRDTGDVVNA